MDTNFTRRMDELCGAVEVIRVNAAGQQCRGVTLPAQRAFLQSAEG